MAEPKKNERRLLGLDEAGRGCVLGPLVVGAFCWEGEDQAVLRAAGADDSKALSARKREEVLARLGGLGVGEVVEITPAAIDAGNINNLEEDAFVAHILRFAPDVVYIDAPVNPRGIPAFSRRIAARLAEADLRPRLVIEPKADATWPVVGAASIFAKVLRDARITALGEVGSGYPSDPVTRRWIQGFFERGEALPPSVRARWGTIADLRQQGLFGP